MFSGAVAPTERIYSLRREVTDFYRAVHPLLAVVGTLERGGRPGAAPVPAGRARPPAPGQRGGRRPARSARHHPGGQHGGDLGGADEGQRAAERHDRAAHRARHRVPAADVRHRVLRAELRLAGQQHRRPAVIRGLRDRRAGPAADAAVLLAAPQPGRLTGPRFRRGVVALLR